ncbi:hypothetical protein R1sor_027149 [Riccia sorocarpa]|uniref:SWIM-type domain-containing protein n=1 Tax=Riccia sorocarpa TaxID=122646 RepID=A0ABD3GH27_9MARC
MQRYALSAIKNARSIPDTDVCIQQISGKNVGFVKSQTNPEKVHEIVSFDTELAACTCPQATQGNICKHQIKCLLMQGHTEADLLHRLGTRLGTVDGGLSPAEPDNEVTGDVLDLDDVLDMNEISPSEDSAPDEELPVENVVSEANNSQVSCSTDPKILDKDDALEMVSSVFNLMGADQQVLAHAAVLLTDACEAKKKLVARSSSLEAVSVEPFAPIPGSDNTLCRKPDFIEHFFSGSRSRKKSQNTPPQNLSQSVVAVPEFRRKQQRRESMQESLDGRALLSIDLNASPTDYSMLSSPPASRASKRKK